MIRGSRGDGMVPAPGSAVALVGVVLGVMAAAAVHLLLEGTPLPERGTGPAVIAGLSGLAVALAIIVGVNRWRR